MLRMQTRLFAAAAVLVLTACGGGGGGGTTTGGTTSSYPTTPSDPTNSVPNSVNATASATFDPSTLTVAKGTTVTFAFASLTHNVTFDAATGVPADIPNMTNASVTRTFSTVGAFAFHCTLHGAMRGTVTVQ